MKEFFLAQQTKLLITDNPFIEAKKQSLRRMLLYFNINALASYEEIFPNVVGLFCSFGTSFDLVSDRYQEIL